MDFFKTKIQRLIRRLTLPDRMLRALLLVGLEFLLLAVVYTGLLASAEPLRMVRLFARYHLLLGISGITLMFAIQYAAKQARESLNRIIQLASGTWLLHIGVYAMVRIFTHEIVPLHPLWLIFCFPLGAIGVTGGISFISEHLIDD